MLFKLKQSELNEALSLVSKAIPKSAIVPAVLNILFDVSLDKVIITASNIKINIETTIECNSDKPVKISIPGSKLISLIKSLPNQELRFSVVEKEIKSELFFTLTVKSSSGSYLMPVENGSDFPILMVKPDFSATVILKELKKSIDRTIFAAGGDDEKFQQALLEFEPNRLNVVGGCHHLLSCYSGATPDDIQKRITINTEVLDIISGMSGEENTNLLFSEKGIEFKLSEKCSVRALLNEIAYADYRFVINPSEENILSINRSSFLLSIKRVMIFSDTFTQIMRISLLDSKVVLSTDNEKEEQGYEEVDAEYSGENMEIGVNGKILIEQLSKLSSETIYLYFTSPFKAVVMREDKSLEKENLMLIMPMLLKN